MKMLSFLFLILLPLPAIAAIDIQKVETDQGITAWLVEDHAIPFAALEIRFRGGTSLDVPGHRGAVNLMAALLEEGSGDLDAQGFAQAKESLAASFGYDANRDSVTVSARFLTENRDQAIALLKSSLHAPRFDQDALDRVRAQVLAGIRSDARDPQDIAGRAFAETAFGDHPYGSPGNGTADSVAALTRDDIVAAYRSVFARDRLYVAAVGDISAADLSALLDDLLADLPETGAPLPAPAEVSLKAGVTVVDFDTPQSVVVFGQPGMERLDPDFIPAFVMNEILGAGGFESRLMQEVREKRGLTYGVYSVLVTRDLASVVMGGVSSSNDRVAEAIGVIRDEWKRMAEQGVTAQELVAVKKYLTGAYPLRFDGNARIARIMVSMQMQGVPMDYIATRNDRVNALSLEQVNRVASELLDPEALHFVVVGRPENLEPAGVAGN